MATATLTIQLEGSLDDNGNVRLDEFIDELTAIKLALKETERIVAGRSNILYYRIVDLTHTSPARVRIEGVAPKRENQHVPRRVFRRFTTSLRMIQRRHRAPRDFDLQALEAFKNISGIVYLTQGSEKRTFAESLLLLGTWWRCVDASKGSDLLRWDHNFWRWAVLHA